MKPTIASATFTTFASLLSISAFQLLVRSQCNDLRIDLKDLLAYPLTPVPYSIATSDGLLNKADKSKGYHFLTKDVEDVPHASASMASRSISEVADAPDEIQFNLSFCSISNGLMKPTIASATFTTFASLLSS
jgi:hypothetical protein